MSIQYALVNITLLTIIFAVYAITKLIKAISLFILGNKLNVGNKGLVFVPIYWNLMEIKIIEKTLKEKFSEAKVASFVAPILLLLGTYAMYSEPGDNQAKHILRFIIFGQYIIVSIFQIIIRTYTLRCSNGGWFFSILFGVIITDFWAMYQIKLLNDVETERETIIIKRKRDLEKMGTRVEWK